jgi:lysophospholipase L1-like esterase
MNTTNNPNNPSGVVNKIMPLGASRVAGARPIYESYRYDLWKLLIDGNYNFDFIGTETDPGNYPMYNGQSFDTNHEGRGGITSGGILAELEMWLGDLGTKPDIVLFSSPGGNDGAGVLDQTELNIKAIIDILQTNNPNVTIFLELPAPPMTSQQTPEFLAYYNDALQRLPQIAAEKTTATSSVLTIDMKTNFIDAYLADDVHYNEAGANFIANRYYDVLTSILQ